MLEDLSEGLLSGGISLIVVAVIIRVVMRFYHPTYLAMSKDYEEAGYHENAEKLNKLAHSTKTREARYFYSLIIVGIAMIAVSLVGRI